MEPIIKRLDTFIKHKGYSYNSFATTLGYSSSEKISRLFRVEKAKPSYDIIKDIANKFAKELNTDWLITGKGKMLKGEVIPVGKTTHSRLNAEDYHDAFPGWDGVPVYNHPISAGFVEHYADQQAYEPAYKLRDPRFKNCDFAAVITGDSMHDEIRHGDYVVCQEIQDKSFIVFGDIYYVVADNGLETCKYLNADSGNEDRLLLMPKNKSVSPSPIMKSMIIKLYKVKGIIRGY